MGMAFPLYVFWSDEGLELTFLTPPFEHMKAFMAQEHKMPSPAILSLRDGGQFVDEMSR